MSILNLILILTVGDLALTFFSFRSHSLTGILIISKRTLHMDLIHQDQEDPVLKELNSHFSHPLMTDVNNSSEIFFTNQMFNFAFLILA